MLDKITITNLEVYAFHGVFPEEKKIGQRFLISADLYPEYGFASYHDQLENTINYGEVALFIRDKFLEHSYDLIETCANELAEALLQQFPPLRKVALTVSKPGAPVPLSFENISVSLERSWEKAYISLGSNLGAREDYLKKALERLKNDPHIRSVKVSSFLETEPWGNTAQDAFINAACEIETYYTPHALLHALQAIENDLGRERHEHWGPRTIDLDLLYHGANCLASKELTLPHPYIQERLFVLEPLAEIAPFFVDPLSHKHIMTLYHELKEKQ